MLNVKVFDLVLLYQINVYVCINKKNKIMANIDLEKTFEGLEIVDVYLSTTQKRNLIIFEAQSKDKRLLLDFYRFLEQKFNKETLNKKKSINIKWKKKNNGEVLEKTADVKVQVKDC